MKIISQEQESENQLYITKHTIKENISYAFQYVDLSDDRIETMVFTQEEFADLYYQIREILCPMENIEKCHVDHSEKLKEIEANDPRGDRKDYLKITITLPAYMLSELRAVGMRRKSHKMKDTDTSSLIREAIVDFLKRDTIFGRVL